MTTSFDVALLAPVPLEHLKSGAAICTQHGKLAFGSMAWEVFRKLDELRADARVHTYLYASHTNATPILQVSWHAFYIGHVESVGGTHPNGMKFRPPTTAKYLDDNIGTWAIFWEVEDLNELSQDHRIWISQLRGLDKKKHFAQDFIPEGPILIECP